MSGQRQLGLFEQVVQQTWQWCQHCPTVRWFTDGERRYSQQLWKLAAVWLKRRHYPQAYPHRKVWQKGLEVAMKIKGSQGKPRRAWCKVEHPWTAISPAVEIHANHCEAHNAAIRRRCSAFRRRQNLYAKTVEGLQRAITVQRLIHNWVRPHWSLKTTPAATLGLVKRPLSLEKMLLSRGFHDFPT